MYVEQNFSDILFRHFFQKERNLEIDKTDFKNKLSKNFLNA